MRFTKDHEWLTEDEVATVGITSFAADALGDVVFVELPEVGTVVSAGDPAGEIESTKSVSEVYAPADGEIVEVNQAVVDDPALINSDPYGKGWLYRLRVSGTPVTLSDAEYEALVAGEAS
ncbi:glycine cleavage system H protein [Actinoplanes octamycinicus]|uniref:Glycine cleavage system H protein n=1 Tax=Actinoplanes octamycinicus TaxID=135948 RepID=A0A7W7MB27_9ACTN|nr:glycine cleavage system protein GcvH [Actinoplanes octamycinicus]MBB4743689.1 glycine cleavage system H protein [Actinoplanes octamycinicus]GIE61118.1 glycine cleavage system H protein [Actinoplanes octamycinicus]